MTRRARDVFYRQRHWPDPGDVAPSSAAARERIGLGKGVAGSLRHAWSSDQREAIRGNEAPIMNSALGAVLLIIGAALLMRVETSFRLLGYPGLAILFFLLAAGGAVALILDIVIHDERRP